RAFFLSPHNFEKAIAGGFAWGVRNRHRTKQIPQRPIEPLLAPGTRPAMWELPPWELLKQHPPVEYPQWGRKEARPTNADAAWCCAPSPVSLARCLLLSFVFFFPVHFSNRPRSSKSVIPRTMRSAWIQSGSKNIAFGWIALPTVCSLSMPVAHISV